MDINFLVDVCQLAVALLGVPILLFKLAELKKGLYAQTASSIYEKYIELDRTFLGSGLIAKRAL